MGNRKVEITFKTSPAELRIIADCLEKDKIVRVNWYHTQFVFKNENATQPAVEADGLTASTYCICGTELACPECDGYSPEPPPAP